MPAVTTTTRDLGDSRVRVEVEVEPKAVEREVAGAAERLGRQMRIPGFRKGKVPPQVVIQRVGREAVLDEAVRSGLPAWYEEAIGEAGLVTVGHPKLDLSDLPDRGEALEFSIEVAVRPTATLGEYKDLEVGRREPEVPDEAVEAEVERLRESVASLEPVERAAGRGDFAVLDFTGTVDGEAFEGGEARGYLLELGSGRLVEGFEEQLEGASAGDEREVRVSFPDDYRNETLAGNEAVFAVEVKEVREKRLPELDDDFAAEAGGFETLDELREDLRERLGTVAEREVEAEFREAVLDSAARGARVELSEELIHQKAHDMWHATERRLQSQGIDPAQYLQVAGKSEEEIISEAHDDAERAIRREAVLAAAIEAEQIEVSDDEVLDALRAAAAGEGGAPPSERKLQRSFDRLRQSGRDQDLREDIAMRKALDVMVESATPISVDQAKARDKLWTPEKEREEAGSPALWTPGS